MRTFSMLVLSLGLAAVLGGCASTSRVMLGPTRAAIAPEQVRVYYVPPPGRYVEIAMLETSSGGLTYGDQNKMNQVIGTLRVEAAKLGANAVVLQGTDTGYRSGGNVGVGIGGGRFGGRSAVGGSVGVNVSPTPTYARGLAIYVSDPPPDEPRPPPRN